MVYYTYCSIYNQVVDKIAQLY